MQTIYRITFTDHLGRYHRAPRVPESLKDRVLSLIRMIADDITIESYQEAV